MTKDKITKLRDMVEYALQYHPSTRNSDVTLTICVWKQFYPRLIDHTSGQSQVALKDLYELPREDNIKRIRAAFNAAGLFWPTEEMIAKKRGINQLEWRKWLQEHKQTQATIDELLAEAKADGAFEV